MKRSTKSFLTGLFVFAVVALGCRSCPPPTPPNNNGGSSPGPTTSPTATMSQSNATVRRVDSNVMAGESAPLPLLTDNNPHDLVPRARVSTDANGEARLELAGCDIVYLFQLSKITYATCSKSESISGSVNCLEGGTAVYNSECAGRIEQIIQTPTAEIVPKGTWFCVTYVPERQLTVTWVMKGTVEVRPVMDMERRELGEPILISAGQSSAVITLRPGAEDFGQIAELRRAKPASEMPDWVKETLAPWLDRIKKHADADGVTFDRNAFSSKQGWPIDCDCGHVEAGILTKQYYDECLKTQLALIDQYRKTGVVSGACNPVAQGPNAKPKG